jgi:hypothetical protein
MSCQFIFLTRTLMLMNTSAALSKLGRIGFGSLRQLVGVEAADSSTGELSAGFVVIGELSLDAKVLSVSYINHLTADHGKQNLLAAKFGLRDLEEVVFEDDNVSELADFKRADLLVGAEETGAVNGDGLEGGFAGDSVARELSVEGRALGCGGVGVLRITGASDGDLECKELIERINLFLLDVSDVKEWRYLQANRFHKQEVDPPSQSRPKPEDCPFGNRRET